MTTTSSWCSSAIRSSFRLAEYSWTTPITTLATAASENSRSSQRPIRITTTAHSAIARLNSVNTCTRRICPSERDVSRDWTLTRPAASRSATSAAVSPVIPATPVNPRPVPLSGADGCADAGEGEAMAQNLPSRRGAGHPTRG